MEDFDFHDIYAPVQILLYNRREDTTVTGLTLLAYEKVTQKIIAIGEEAIWYQKQPDERIEVVCPMKRGMIGDYIVSVKIFQHYIQQSYGKKAFARPKVVFCIPEDSSQVEKKAFEDTLYQAGAKQVVLTTIPFEQAKQSVEPDFPLIIGLHSVSESTL